MLKGSDYLNYKYVNYLIDIILILFAFWNQPLDTSQVRNHKRPNFGPVVANMLPKLDRQCCAITKMISKGCTWPPALARH